MADITYLRDNPHLSDQTLTLDPVPYFDFDFYPSDPEFPPSPHPAFFPQPFDVDASLPFAAADRHNQANFVMDLFQQRVEQSQLSDSLNDSGFGVVEAHSDLNLHGLGLDLGLGLGFCAFENSGSGFGGSRNDIDDDDDLFIRLRPSDGNCVSVSGFESDSEKEEENGVELRMCLHSDDDEDDDGYNVENDDISSIPLCWDSLILEEDDNNNNGDLEWEEVDDGRGVDEREVLSMLSADAVEVSVSTLIGIEEEEEVMENLGWELLFNGSNLVANADLDNDAEPYFGDLGDHDEYEMMFGQFAEHENPFMGKPPASASLVQSLPSLVVTEEDVDKNNALCAVCKDDFSVGEQVKQLPCLHRYHGDCITPWLQIRNTCPVCRYEMPTDDADYERKRAQRSGSRT
ncbi:hypothetical protein RIF29_10076 [Crotalaria pallida]|uniref:RING-type E3 ubiquitin transferase n=1 Tax=Crotalaria pallida TaxID=3830 RepID=A0AAN9FVE0_CROPI